MKPKLPKCRNRIQETDKTALCASDKIISTQMHINVFESCIRLKDEEWTPCPYADLPNEPVQPEWDESQPSRGLGDTIAKVTKVTGIKKVVKKTTGGNCGCPKRQTWMNEAVPYGSPSIENPRPHPFQSRVTRWAVGVTSAPRKSPTLVRCAESLIETGFDSLTVFAEPGTDVDGLPECVDIIMRPETIAEPRFEAQGRFGVWRNYVQTMADLLEKHPEAEAVFIVQDDIVFAKDLRAFLECDLWPSFRTGAVSPYCPNFPQYENAKQAGPKRIKQRYLMGACAMVYPRDAVEEILNSNFARDWKGRAKHGTVSEPEKKAAADAWIGNALKKLKYQVHYYTPSLCQHVAKYSTIGHGGPVGKRRSRHFPGEDKSAFDVMAGDRIWVRYDTDGKQRFARPRGPEPREPVSIIIPAVDSPDLTERCLEHVAHGTETELEVIYIDNGSQEGVAEQIRDVADNLGLPVVMVKNEMNLGFSRAMNQGIARSAGRDVLLLNNDCFVAQGCIDILYKHLHWHPRAGAVNPLTNDRGMCSRNNSDRIRFGGFGEERVSTHDRLPFFCSLLHREAIHKVGPLSEELASGLGADDLWCHQARKKGYRLLIAYDAFAEHMHSETFRRTKQNRRAMQKQAIKKLSQLKRAK